MSLTKTYKKCTNCGKKFQTDPSVGDPGIMCPYCKKPAYVKFKGKKIATEDKAVIKELLDNYKNNEQ